MSEYGENRRQIELDAIASVKEKMKSGEYPMEESSCPCGANDDQEVRTIDRIGIPHRIVVCKNCAITRANPRMTQSAYSAYYNDEYRKLTYRRARLNSDSRDDEIEAIRRVEHDFAKILLDELVAQAIDFPKIVVDFGCYMGGLLDAFKERGAETWGVEFNDEARDLANQRGHKVFKTIEELIERGVKADLVIMQDVIEHLLDLSEVHKIREIMAPEGYLYIFTPGLFRTDPQYYWQLAHTFYFVANTLNWVMNRMGFDATYIDEDISSFWQYTGVYNDTSEPPREWAEYIIDEAEGKDERRLPPFRGVCKFTKKLLYENMRRNFAMKLPDIHAITGTKSGPLMIVSGGPSVDGQLDKIKELKTAGIPLMVIARMYPWAIQNGLIPDYVVSLDCSEEQEAGFKTIQSTTTHMMATVTRPEIVEMIKDAGAPIYIFDSRDDRKIKDLRRSAGYEVATVINSGGTVAITCMSVAFNLGFNDLHVFGLDCMFPDYTKTHADNIAGKSTDQRILSCTVDGIDLLTTPSFIEFARQALDLVSIAHNEGFLHSVKFYGESIINYMWDGNFYDEDGKVAA